jgi:hypothetical protein
MLNMATIQRPRSKLTRNLRLSSFVQKKSVDIKHPFVITMETKGVHS